MDPNSALLEIREITGKFHKDMPDDTAAYLGSRLAELVEGLDGWLSKGGFKPSDWS